MPLDHFDEPALAAALSRMVRIATINPPGRAYEPMVEHLSRRLRDLGMAPVVHQVPAAEVAAAGADPAYGRYNVVARWDVGAARSVHFNAHYDVVPVSTGTWRTDPFSGQERGGWVYGRGAADMKGSIVALLAALGALRASGTVPALNVEVSFTADEETGGVLGAGWVVDQGLVHADYAIECEGASASRVGVGHNGVLWLDVEVAGRAVHASSPDRGINAFEKMAAVVWHLQPLKRSLAAAARGWRDPEGRRRQPTINVGGTFGGGDGDKVNTVPGRARFSIDRRLVPGEDLDAAEGELREALAEAGKRADARLRLHTALRIAPCVVDPAGPLPQAFARAVRSVRRHSAGFRLTSGFTDLHYFVAAGGMEGIGYGVVGERAHGDDERVSVRDLAQTARTYVDFLRRGVTVNGSA